MSLLQAAKFSTGAAVGAGGILGLFQRNPFTFQVALATIKTSLADLLVQTKVEKKESIDWNRNLLFILFGGLYLGVFQWGVYVIGFQRIFPTMATFCNQSIREKLRNKKGIKELFGQILLDFVFVQPVLYFPVFYGFKTFVDPSFKEGETRFGNAFANWKKNFFQDNIGMSLFWLPMDIVIYSVPLWIRLPLNHGISFLWVCVLSFYRGEDDKTKVVKSISD